MYDANRVGVAAQARRRAEVVSSAWGRRRPRTPDAGGSQALESDVHLVVTIGKRGRDSPRPHAPGHEIVGVDTIDHGVQVTPVPLPRS
ncbi:MAG: hypothetical protein U0Y82_12175 [Thermoleophilia bacterium]